VNAAAIGAQPYVGLRYFEERDADLFYGRDEHVAELLGKLSENRFVAVMGSSGSGKSSLVRAGLLPELRAGMIPKAGPRWNVVEFRPGRAPLVELSAAIRSALGVEEARRLVEEGPLGIARAAAEAKLADGANILVIADQFEEVFRFQREESSLGRGLDAAEQCQALSRRLLDAAAQTELRIYVLLVTRSDYLGECAQFPDLPERMSESLYLVPRLRRDQLQEAITAPVGGEMDPAVVQRLLSEVGSDPDQLPRLQHLLGRMWERARGGRLTMAHYREAGGWDEALERHLEEVYNRLNGPQQGACRRVFQQLSELDKGRAVRRRLEMGQLMEVCGPDAAEVIRAFRSEGFLAPQENPVDITHECILREWPKVRLWLEQEERDAKRLRELAGAAQDAGWRPGMTAEQEKSIGRLEGLTLQNLSAWRDEARPTAAWARRYLPAVDFDTASGYLTWSQMLDQQQKEKQARAARRLRRLSLALIVLLVAALGGVAVAWKERQARMDAERRRIEQQQRARRAELEQEKLRFEEQNRRIQAEARAALRALELRAAEQEKRGLVQEAEKSRQQALAARRIVVLAQGDAPSPGSPGVRTGSPGVPEEAKPTREQEITMIWSGSLEPNAELTINGGQATPGKLTRPMPGRPVRVVSVIPASVRVIEPPSASSQWNVLKLRNGPRPVESIIITLSVVR
jgi:ABC-type Fe3+/spermidine/putrescine transport system ATPase subunit